MATTNHPSDQTKYPLYDVKAAATPTIIPIIRIFHKIWNAADYERIVITNKYVRKNHTKIYQFKWINVKFHLNFRAHCFRKPKELCKMRFIW